MLRRSFIALAASAATLGMLGASALAQDTINRMLLEPKIPGGVSGRSSRKPILRCKGVDNYVETKTIHYA